MSDQEEPIVPRPEQVEDISDIVVGDPYSACESFEDVFKVFMGTDPEMRKFFGKDNSE